MQKILVPIIMFITNLFLAKQTKEKKLMVIKPKEKIVSKQSQHDNLTNLG